jgi:hypothetical protein
MPDSNINTGAAWIAKWIDSFSFGRPGAGQSLGGDMANTVAEQIAERSSRQVDPYGKSWSENSSMPSHWQP